MHRKRSAGTLVGQGWAGEPDDMTLTSDLRPGRPLGTAWLRARRVAAPGWLGQFARFGVVGGGSSVLQMAAYAFLADSIGSQPANVVSWLASTLLATELHRRFSFRGPLSGAEGDHVVGVVTSLAALLLGAATLAALGDPSETAGVLALMAVNVLVGALRFVVLRWWMVGRTGPIVAQAPAVPIERRDVPRSP